MKQIVTDDSQVEFRLVAFNLLPARLVTPPSVSLPSLLRFSISALPFYIFTTLPAESRELVTMNRSLGKSSSSCHSILPPKAYFPFNDLFKLISPPITHLTCMQSYDDSFLPRTLLPLNQQTISICNSSKYPIICCQISIE